MAVGAAYQLVKVSADRNALPGLHTHDYAEVFWIDHGRCRHSIGPTAQLLGPGAVVFIRPGDCHRLRPAGVEGLGFTNLAFDQGVLRHLRGRHERFFGRLYDPQAELPTAYTLEPARLAWVQERALRLAAQPAEGFFLEHFLFELAGVLLGDQAGAVLPADAPDWLRNALLRIREPELFCQGARGLVQAAGRCHEHVTRACRRYLDTTPTQLIGQARMDHAAMRLRLSSAPIKQIARECGYTNPAHFYEVFRGRFGQSPGEFRRISRLPV